MKKWLHLVVERGVLFLCYTVSPNKPNGHMPTGNSDHIQRLRNMVECYVDDLVIKSC